MVLSNIETKKVNIRRSKSTQIGPKAVKIL